MSFAARLTRCPNAFDRDAGAEVAASFSDLAPELTGLVSGTAGCSPYLGGLIAAEADWLRESLAGAPEPAFEALLAAVSGESEAELRASLRLAKRRVALLTALADLGGVWSLEEVTGALTRFADLAVTRALGFQVGREIARGKIPGLGPEDDASCAGAVALAMGKMGAFELNYSSDIDLIMLFDDSRFERADVGEARSGLIRATRRMVAMLSELTPEGYVFRTDLRLRPDPSVTPVIMAMEAAEQYYESVGRTWERAAHIKARPAAGDLGAGAAYLARLTPFVWRRHLDFAAIQDAHDIRLRIRAHRGLAGPAGRHPLEGHDMKLGRGGIREIEFFTQTRQLISGGRDPSLRCPGTVAGLAALAEKDWIGPEVAEVLTRHYRAHREVEHRLQMIADAQTHKLPVTTEGFDRLAAMMGEPTEALRNRLKEALDEVNALTEGFFAPEERAAAAPEMSAETAAIAARWESYPACRSARAARLFERLKPEILSRLGKAARPREAVMEFDRFLAGLPAGVQLFSLFDSNPALIDLIVDICATAPALAVYLGRNSGVFDAVLGGAFFSPWPGEDALEADLAARMAPLADDYEAQLDEARRWMKEWHFRIGVHHLRGLIGGREVGVQYAELAGAVLGALWPVVTRQFAVKHGPPPGRGAMVLGMGSLGAKSLTATSDLDLIVIYDPAGQATSEGPRPLAARSYYARLTQAMVTALTAPTAEGKLYEVDMRLRPSGNQGPVATSLESFAAYQKDEAWTWEHLALTRARPVAGAAEIGAEVERIRLAVLTAPRDAAKTIADVAEMRARIAAAKGAGLGPLEAKLGPGRQQDIELVAQCAAVLGPGAPRHVGEQLAQGAEIGWFTTAEAALMHDAHGLFWRLSAAAKLLTGETLSLDAVGQGGRAFLLRETGFESAEALEAGLEARALAAENAIEAALARLPGEAGP